MGKRFTFELNDEQLAAVAAHVAGDHKCVPDGKGGLVRVAAYADIEEFFEDKICGIVAHIMELSPTPAMQAAIRQRADAHHALREVGRPKTVRAGKG